MIDELEWVKRESPDVRPPSPDARRAARHALQEAIRAEHRRRGRFPFRPKLRLSWLAPVAALLVVVSVVAVFLGVRGHTRSTPSARPAAQLVFRAEATPEVPVLTRVAVSRAVSLIRARVAVALGSNAGVSVRSRGNLIFVRARSGVRISRTRLLSVVGTNTLLSFYDWEENVLTPGGRTVAGQLRRQDPAALEISQGGATGPGSAGAGSMSLYAAVRLASRQPERASPENGRVGPEYFAFAAPGSAACMTAARHFDVALRVHQPCYLAGPDEHPSELYAALPGVSRSQTQVLEVPRGTAVLQAVPQSYAHAPSWFSPSAQFYVLRDRAGLFGNDITRPAPSTDASGQPDVTFQFTRRGTAAFRTLTAHLSRRGAALSRTGEALNQHFAVTLGTQLLSVPSIDFHTYPDGISSSSADLVAGLTRRSARTLAAEIQGATMPVGLKLISVQR